MKTVSIPLPEDWVSTLSLRAKAEGRTLSEEIRHCLAFQLLSEGETLSRVPTRGVNGDTEVTLLLRLKSKERFMARLADLRSLPGLNPKPEKATPLGTALATGKAVRISYRDVGIIRLVQLSSRGAREGWRLRDAAWHLSTCADLAALQALLA